MLSIRWRDKNMAFIQWLSSSKAMKKKRKDSSMRSHSNERPLGSYGQMLWCYRYVWEISSPLWTTLSSSWMCLNLFVVNLKTTVHVWQWYFWHFKLPLQSQRNCPCEYHWTFARDFCEAAITWQRCFSCLLTSASPSRVFTLAKSSLRSWWIWSLHINHRAAWF